MNCRCTLSFKPIVEIPVVLKVPANAKGDILYLKEPALFAYDMTPKEVALCNALLEHEHILVADNVPRGRVYQELCEEYDDVTLISIKAWSEEHKQSFWVETPLSKALIEDTHPKARPAVAQMLLGVVADYNELGLPALQDPPRG